MALFVAGAVVGVATVLAVVIGFALVLEVDDFEQRWESPHYHQGPTADHPESHADDGPP